MAVVMRGAATDEKNVGGGSSSSNRTFHDFLGMSCGEAPPAVVWDAKIGGESRRPLEGAEASASAASAGASSGGGHGLVSGRSDLGSERQPISSFEGLQFHSRRSDISGPGVGSQFSGRKRSNSDSAFMGFMRDRMLPVASDSPEPSQLMKMLGKEVLNERPRRPHDEVVFAMQPPSQPTSSLILNPPIGCRPDSFVSKWESSMPLNAGPAIHYPSRFGQRGTYVDKRSSSCTYKDPNAGVTFSSQAAADEGSRTGIKGAGILNVINSGGGTAEKNSTGMLSGGNKHKTVAQNTEPEPSNVPSRCGISPASRQMTIFYAGQAHVFDDVHPNKADIIMAVAGSNGGSWSTTCSAKSSVRPPTRDGKVPALENKMGISKLPFSQDLNSRLAQQGTSNHGFRPGARIPVMGGHQAGRAVGDARPTFQVAEPDIASKRNV